MPPAPALPIWNDDEEVSQLIDSDKQESVEFLHNILERHQQIKADRERRGG